MSEKMIITREDVIIAIHNCQEVVEEIAWGRAVEYCLYVIKSLPEQFTIAEYQNVLGERMRGLEKGEFDGFDTLSEIQKDSALSLGSYAVGYTAERMDADVSVY